MEPFRASEEDWQVIERESLGPWGGHWRVILELRGRVAALEASAAAATEPPVEPPNDPQILHTVAVGNVLIDLVKSGIKIRSSQLARQAIHAVADWCQARGNIVTSGSQWAEMLRQEAGR